MDVCKKPATPVFQKIGITSFLLKSYHFFHIMVPLFSHNGTTFFT